MQDTRREAEELRREERSPNSLQRCSQSCCNNSTFFQKEPQTYKQAISCNEKQSCLQAMQDEFRSLGETNT